MLNSLSWALGSAHSSEFTLNNPDPSTDKGLQQSPKSVLQHADRILNELIHEEINKSTVPADNPLTLDIDKENVL